MYSKAIALDRFLNLRGEDWLTSPMDKKASFWLMQGDMEKNCATLWINTGLSKLLDWPFNPDECMLCLHLDWPEPLHLFERPKLIPRGDGNWYFDAAAFLRERGIGFVAQNPFRAKYRQNWGLVRNFYAGPFATVHLTDPVPGMASLTGSFFLQAQPSHLQICGLPAQKLELRFWAKQTISLPLFQRLLTIMKAPQHITEEELLCFPEQLSGFDSFSFCGPEGLSVCLEKRWLLLNRYGRKWRVLLEEGRESRAKCALLVRALKAQSGAEVDTIFHAGKLEGLVNDVCCSRTAPAVPPRVNLQGTRFALNRVIHVKGGFYLFMDVRAEHGLPARIQVPVGKRSRQMALMIPPEECLVCYTEDGNCIAEPIPLTEMGDGNLLFDAAEWLKRHNIPFEPMQYRECQKMLNHPFRCWIFPSK